MKTWVKLVNYELNYFRNSFLAVFFSIIAIQIIGVYVQCKTLLQQAEQISSREYMSMQSVLEQLVSQSTRGNSMFGWSINVGLMMMVGYIVYTICWTWYREWLGSTTTMYRTLLLPFSRLKVYSAKFATSILFIAAFIALGFCLQYGMNVFANWLLNGIDYPILSEKIAWFKVQWLFLNNKDVLLNGFVIVSLLSSLVLLERSFQWKGFISGIALVIMGVITCILPHQSYVFGQLYEQFFFWELEIYFYSSAIVCGIFSQGLNMYLVTKRIGV